MWLEMGHSWSVVGSVVVGTRLLTSLLPEKRGSENKQESWGQNLPLTRFGAEQQIVNFLS